MNNNSLGEKLLMAAVTLLLAVYFGLQGYQYFADPLSTTLAYTHQVDASISLSGYVVREELVLANESQGVLQLLRSEGQRVAANGAVAAVYADSSTVDLQAQIDALNDRVSQLQYIIDAEVGVDVAQQLDQQITQNLLDYRAAVTANNLSDAEKQGAQLRDQILKRDYTNADTQELVLQVQTLQAQAAQLQAQTSGSMRRITSPDSGLYSAVTDGYEYVLTPDSILEMTPSQLGSVIPDTSALSNVGKVVLGQYWYYAAAMTTEEVAQLQKEPDRALALRFTNGVNRDLSVELHSIGTEEEGRCVVVFRGAEYLAQLTLLRQQSAQVIINTTEGIRVPTEALRVVSEQPAEEPDQEDAAPETQTIGVYCVIGREARFKPVEILYRGENFALVAANQPADREVLRLRPGDEVIVSARDLYDGKVIS